MDRLENLERIAHRMDNLLRVPGTRIRFGLDAILGLVPGIGDALALAPAAYIINESRRMGAPNHILMRQGINTGVDALIGSIPLVGDLFDIGNKANKKNVALLRAHLEKEEADRETGPLAMQAN